MLAFAAGCAQAPASQAPAPSEAVAPAAASMPGAAALDVPSVPVVPDVAGASAEEAASTLAAAGARMAAVVFAAGGPVTAQYPPAGAPVPDDGVVTAWIGAPPAPAPPAPPAEPAVAAAPAGGAPADVEPPPAPPVEQVEPIDDDMVDADPDDAGAASTAEAAPAPPPRLPVAPVVAGAAAPVDAGAGTAGGNIRTAPPPPSRSVWEGRASWYGDELNGSPVACGGRFNPRAYTLASRELRCGTVVRVTGATGRQVDAIVTDWGPAVWTGRRFDLSMATFAAIAPLSAGVIAIRLEVH